MLEEGAVRRVDRSGFLDQVRSLPEQIPHGLELGATVGAIARGRRTIVLGMGGSGIAGEVLSAWLASERGLAVSVVRDSHLPPGIGEGDLVVAVSYSGNTLETLAATRDAVARGCDLAGLASGGTLRDLCTARGLPFAKLPTGFTPRAAFGYVFGALAAFFGDDLTRDVREAAEALRMRAARLETHVGETKNPAKRLAQKLKGRTPIIYGAGPYAPIARRWQTQFNENAKLLAWASVLPEADHNELVGWSGDSASKRFAPIFLRDPQETDDHRQILDATHDLIRRKASVEEVRADGHTLLARMLSTLQLGDWTSIYLAVLRKVDPMPVAVIEKLKARLAKGS